KTSGPHDPRRCARPPSDTGSAASPRARGAGGPRAHAACQLARDGWRAGCAPTLSIWSAAAAASLPLFDGPSPARSIASSTELVFSTPNVIGTPVAADAEVSPLATADAMYSKCGVAPRMTQPRQTTASYPPLSAARCAAIGISKAPGT